MSWIEQKYITYLGTSLSKFTKLNDRAYNFRCPYCGDSRTNLNKARGYLFVHEGEWIYKCHNCGKSTTFNSLLKFVSPNLHSEFRMEKFKCDSGEVVDELDIAPKVENVNLVGILQKLSQLNNDHLAIKYCKNRKIPEKFYNSLYYSSDLNTLKNNFGSKYTDTKFKKDSRLIIPFKNDRGDVIAVTARALDKVPQSERYVILRSDDDEPLIYGIDCIDRGKEILVVEGPIDSLFLDNCIAVSGSDLSKALKKLPLNNLLFIFDNQPRNKEIIDKMKKLIDVGCSIVIWPENISKKDINEMVLSGIDVKSVIHNCKYSGMMAKLKLSDWSKR